MASSKYLLLLFAFLATIQFISFEVVSARDLAQQTVGKESKAIEDEETLPEGYDTPPSHNYGKRYSLDHHGEKYFGDFPGGYGEPGYFGGIPGWNGYVGGIPKWFGGGGYIGGYGGGGYGGGYGGGGLGYP
ncbi:5'-3' exoribonuclease 2-like [Dioscorea cayenensis subsp. rotundata]|uniref:5'-3' exoribonuclease 2-like n=1 Tax=Dioscorea cayennensis subsp. rotundata TaxID=55577 RepID=A0AB40AY89_DIOCR|nr:5'-3' exoribonuclease 2-like [Dioscorea cayenensis subsp. rotundata]